MQDMLYTGYWLNIQYFGETIPAGQPIIGHHALYSEECSCQEGGRSLYEKRNTDVYWRLSGQPNRAGSGAGGCGSRLCDWSRPDAFGCPETLRRTLCLPLTLICWAPFC